MDIKKITVRRYRDNGDTVAIVEWFGGASTQGRLRTHDIGRGRIVRTFGTHMHELFKRAKREGLRLQWDTWR